MLQVFLPSPRWGEGLGVRGRLCKGQTPHPRPLSPTGGGVQVGLDRLGCAAVNSVGSTATRDASATSIPRGIWVALPCRVAAKRACFVQLSGFAQNRVTAYGAGSTCGFSSP